MNNNRYILIIRPSNEIEAAVNNCLDEYDLWHAPFAHGENICQAMVRKDNDTNTLSVFPVGRASSVMYNVDEVSNAQQG